MGERRGALGVGCGRARRREEEGRVVAVGYRYSPEFQCGEPRDPEHQTGI